ncbi:hypothetical protein DFP73DRAFT_550818 [Morchella snyderi]|nr:hypothetical protein DFP73DRAFT_550818 [Morchella snyderi]
MSGVPDAEIGAANAVKDKAAEQAKTTPTKAEKTHAFTATVGNSQRIIDTMVEKQETQPQARWRAVKTITAASIQQKVVESSKRILGEEVLQEDAVLVSPKKPRVGLTEDEIRALGRAMKQEVTESKFRLLAQNGTIRKYGKYGVKVELKERKEGKDVGEGRKKIQEGKQVDETKEEDDETQGETEDDEAEGHGIWKGTEEEEGEEEEETEGGETEEEVGEGGEDESKEETEAEREEKSGQERGVDEAMKAGKGVGGEAKTKTQSVEGGERGKERSNVEGNEEQKSEALIHINEEVGKE